MERLLLFITTSILNVVPRIAALVLKYFIYCLRFYDKYKTNKLLTTAYVINSKGERAVLYEYMTKLISLVKRVVPTIIFFGLIPTSVVLIVIFLIRFLLPYIVVSIILLGIILEWIEEKNTEQQSTVMINLKNNIRHELFLSLREISSLLPVKPPNIETEIDTRVSQQMGIWFATASIIKAQNNALSSDELELVKAQIQSVIKIHLENGQVFGANCATVDGETPLLFVNDVYDAGIHIQVNLVIVDSPEAVSYAKRERSRQEKSGGFDRDF